MSSFLLTIVTVTRDDPDGLARSLASAADWRAEPGVEQVVVHAGDAPPDLPAGVRAVGPSARGIAAAFNDGWRAAAGEWIWFLNGGDAAHEELAPAWLLTLLRRTSADMIVGTIQDDGRAEPRRLPPLREQWPMLDSWPPHPAVLVRRQRLENVGGFSERYRTCMDFDLWQRLVGRGARVDVVAMPFARYNVHGVSSRSGSLGVLFRENARVVWRHQGNVWRAAGRGLGGAMIRCLRGVRHLFS